MELIDDLAAALIAATQSPGAPHIGSSLRRLLAAIGLLPESFRPNVQPALDELRPTTSALAESVRAGRLDASVHRDLTTLERRLSAMLEHLTEADPGVLGSSPVTVDYAKVDVIEVVREVCDRFAPLAEEEGVELRVQGPPALHLEAERSKLELALTNLLFNALKRTTRGGWVLCEVRKDRAFDEVVIAVEDDGRRIPRALHSIVFDRARVVEHNVSSDIGPWRLALGLSRDAIALQGGTLDFTLRGSNRFEIRVPRLAPRGATVSHDTPGQAPGVAKAVSVARTELRDEADLGACPIADDDRPRALVIAHDRSLNRVLARSLEPDFATASAFDGDVGTELALGLRPDVVVVDLDLPGGGGETVAMSLRGLEPVHALILALIEDRNSTQVLRLLDAGIHDFVAKPILLAETRGRARRLLATKRTQDVLGETIGQRDTDLIALAEEVAETHHSLAQKNAELEVARERAERASEMKSRFLRIMSHELKTPLTAVKLQVNVLERDESVVRTDSLERGLQRIERSTNRLVHLVDTTLAWARVEDGRCRPEVEDIDLAACVRDSVAVLEGPAEARGIRFEAVVRGEEPIELSTDRRLVRIVMLNLLDYVLLASVEGTIRIRIGRCETGGRVTVHDVAPALTDEQREELLDPLAGGRSWHHRSGAGSGLGLHAVSSIAHAIGGTIRLGSTPDQHNSFVFELPNLRVGANPLARTARL